MNASSKVLLTVYWKEGTNQDSMVLFCHLCTLFLPRLIIPLASVVPQVLPSSAFPVRINHYYVMRFFCRMWAPFCLRTATTSHGPAELPLNLALQAGLQFFLVDFLSGKANSCTKWMYSSCIMWFCKPSIITDLANVIICSYIAFRNYMGRYLYILHKNSRANVTTRWIIIGRYSARFR